MMRTSLGASPRRLAAVLLAALLIAIVIHSSAGLSAAQGSGEPPMALGAAQRAQTVGRVIELLDEVYVLPLVAARGGRMLRRRLERGDYDVLTDAKIFADTLTQDLRATCNDRHLRVRLRPPRIADDLEESGETSRDRSFHEQQTANFGFEQVRRLENNVGYLDLRFFRRAAYARETAIAAMNFLATSEALIIDLRQNRGGDPSMVQLLASYFFDEPTHLNSFVGRDGKVSSEVWTLATVPGTRMVDTPLFILTSSSTGSAAEGFAYHLKHLGRATLIGETTVGAANPGDYYPVNETFHVFIPDLRALNPVTQSNWEGVGVAPHHRVDADGALDEAIVMARANAEQRSLVTASRLQDRWQQTDLLLKQARAHFDAKRYDEAAQRFARAAGMDPDHALAWLSLGYTHHFAGHYEQAIAPYERAASFRVARAEALYQLACIHSLLDRKKAGLQALAEAIDAGFAEFGQMAVDSDLDNIRGEPGFPKFPRAHH